MTRKRPPTLDALARGEGTKKQRKQLEDGLAKLAPRIRENVQTITNAAAALALAGVPVQPHDDLPSLVERARRYPLAAPILWLLRLIEQQRETLRRLQEQPRQAALAPRSGITQEEAKCWVRRFVEIHGTERGSITQGAAHFGITRTTFKKILSG